ncbi:MAG: type III pantothenate kinase [Cellvibrionaceae bacterium]
MLLIDVGNTQIKLRNNAGCMQSIRHGGDPERVLSILPKSGMAGVAVASVAGKKFNASLKLILEAEGYSEIFFVAVSRVACGVSCGYERFQDLGVDRWLVAIAGYRKTAGAVIVVDAGSAITIDVVDADGNHLGGYIFQGLNMLVSNLSSQTMAGHMDLDCISGDEALSVGRNTQDGIANGAMLAAVGAVSTVVKKYEERVELLLTGGDGRLLQRALVDSLDIDCVYCDGLVLDGLSLVVGEGGKK